MINLHKKTGTKDVAWIISSFVMVAGLLFTLVVVLYQHYDYSKPIKADLSHIEMADESYKFYIDTIEDASTQGDYFHVSGWAAHVGEDLGHFNMYLILYQESLEDALVFKVAVKSRKDVTLLIDDGHNYDSSGFVVNVKRSLIEDMVYNVALLYNDTEEDNGARIVLTGATMQHEEITNVQ